MIRCDDIEYFYYSQGTGITDRALCRSIPQNPCPFHATKQKQAKKTHHIALPPGQAL